MKINDKLENLSFQVTENRVISDIDLKNNISIIYFYPKDDTPGCTKEAIEFSDHYEKLKSLEVKVIGVSKDSLEKHKKFKDKYDIKFDLASDDGTLCDIFNVWVEKSMYGKKYMGIQRSTFVINKDLKILNIWRNVKVKGHVEEVYNFIKNLG